MSTFFCWFDFEWKCMRTSIGEGWYIVTDEFFHDSITFWWRLSLITRINDSYFIDSSCLRATFIWCFTIFMMVDTPICQWGCPFALLLIIAMNYDSILKKDIFWSYGLMIHFWIVISNFCLFIIFLWLWCTLSWWKFLWFESADLL